MLVISSPVPDCGKDLRTIDFAPRGESDRTEITSPFSPGRICRMRQILPTPPGKYFHFYSNADDKNLAYFRAFFWFMTAQQKMNNCKQRNDAIASHTRADVHGPGDLEPGSGR